jgi:hypothetical protein
MNKPNIFNCATQEVSLQAFLCWFLQWLDPNNMTVNIELHKLSCKLLEAFFNKHNVKPPLRIEKIDLSGGYRNISILLIINDSIDMPIQHKIYNIENPDQLSRCIELLKDDGYDGQNMLAIYIQTGARGNNKKLRVIGFLPFSLKDLLDVLSSGNDINNDILKDYIEHLGWIDRQMQGFMYDRLNEWHFLFAWQGFYSYLQDKLNDGAWDYVMFPHRNSFPGFWWHETKDEDCDRYLQLEKDMLCFKIKAYDKDKRKDLKKKWTEKFIKASEDSFIKVVKPKVQSDNAITVAAVDGDYRRADNEGKIDLTKTLDVLLEAQNIFDKAVKVF